MATINGRLEKLEAMQRHQDEDWAERVSVAAENLQRLALQGDHEALQRLARLTEILDRARQRRAGVACVS